MLPVSACSVTLTRQPGKFMNFRNINHIRVSTMFLVVMLALLCMTAPACSSRPAKLSSGSRPPEISAPEALRETVLINGETFVIPPPWTGNRFAAPEFDSSDFQRIPVEYTHESSKVYILDTAHYPLVSLLHAAEKEGIFLKVESAYRSERYQKHIFKRMLAQGRSFEDIVRYVAPPGYSEHMLGTAVDFYPSNWRFADTIAYTWLRENGRRFGFEESYSRFNPTKIPWEAWHWNFTGRTQGYQAVSDFQQAGSSKKLGTNGQE